MIGLDTNVLLRILLGDDPVQSPIAERLLRSATTKDGPVFVSVASVLEVVWVLRSRYKLHPEEICTALRLMLFAEGVYVQNEREVFSALSLYEEGSASFEDALIGLLGTWVGCSKTVTFDRNASRLPAFELAE